MTDKNSFFDDYKRLMESVTVLEKTADNPFYKSQYVPLPEVLLACKKVALETNFILIQSTNDLNLITELRHVSGEKIVSTIPIIAKDISDPQKVGAGITYMRRYSLTNIFGFAESDDDGNTASEKKETKPQPEKAPEPSSQDEIKMRSEIGNWLMEIQGNKEDAQTMLESITRFKGKDGKFVDGVRETERLKGTRLKIAHDKIKKEYDDFKDYEGGK
jgi:hypothetical protein